VSATARGVEEFSIVSHRPSGLLCATTSYSVAKPDPRTDAAMAPAAEQRKPGPVTRTYRYLRIGLAGTVVVIFVAVGVEMVQGSHLGSISAYYYTGARTPFVGALFAAAVTLAALAGNGSGRILLSIAAIFAPIIALVPTPLKHGVVPTLVDDCGAGSCIPSAYLPDIRTGVWTYLVVGVLAIALLLVLAARRSISWQPTLLVAGILAVVVLVLGVGWTFAPDVILRGAHYAAAGVFFALIGAAALHNARAPQAPGGGYVQTFRVARPRPHARILYIAVAAGEIANLLVFIVVLSLKLPIIYDEAAALILFVLFWLTQTFETVDLPGSPRTIDPR
jgi:hypothetical protein